MAIKSINRLHAVRTSMIRARNLWLRIIVGVDLDISVNTSLSARLKPARRGSITVGRDTLIAFKTLIYTRDTATGADRPVRIGERCFIGGGSTITPGVTIGDECIVAAGAVVFDDVPSRCIVAGNRAKILQRDIKVVRYGRLKAADDNPMNWTVL